MPALLPVFNALPGAFLLLTPTLQIAAVSDDYLAATLTKREALLGEYLFDVFPDNPAAPEAHATRNLRTSLAQVLATGQPHQMAPQHYDIPILDQPGQFIERYWLPVNRPVFDEQGRVTHLLHAVTDVTEQLQADAQRCEAQTAEKAARTEIEVQRQRLYHILENFPAVVASYRGPTHIFDLVSHRFQRDFPTRTIKGLPVREALPELEGQQYYEILDGVYQTGEPFYGTELETWVDLTDTGKLELQYYNVCFQATRDTEGRIDGILNFAYDVTAEVLARQQLQQLNQTLESRVQERTAELGQQQSRLQQIMGQVPAAIATFEGPEHRLTFFNTSYAALSAHRAQIGLPLAEVYPEVVAQGFVRLLDEVYRTGKPFVGTETPATIFDAATSQPEQHYLDFIYQPLTDAQNHVTGVLAFIVDVTEKVLSRRQAEILQADLLAATQRQAEQREFYYQVFEQTPAAVALLRDPGHRYEYVNPAYQQFFPNRQLVGFDMAEAVPELQEQGFIALMDHVYQTGETYYGTDTPFRVSATDDKPAHTIYFSFTYQAYQEKGQTAGISLFAFNVTEQVLARQERDAQRQRLHNLFQEAPAGICILAGPDLVFEFVNPSYQQLMPNRPLLGLSFLEAVPELAQHSVMNVFQHILATGETHEERGIRARIARPADGVLEDRYFNYIQQARRDGEGRIDGVLVFAFEVTEQVRARQDSEASAHQLRLITDALPVLIGYLDRNEIYRFANRAYQTWFDQEPTALLGRPVREIVGEDAYATTQGYIKRALAGELVEFEAWMPYRADFTKHIRTSYIPDVHQGAVQGFYTLVSDITDQVEARRAAEDSAQQAQALAHELAKANEQLTRTNVDLDNFIYTASHDLKAPINNIEGLLSSLRDELPAQSPAGAVDYILTLMQDSVDRFTRTIEHLTTVSRLQKEHDPPTEPVALAPIIEDVRLDLAPLLQQTGGRLQVNVQHCPLLTFSEKNLRSVVYNLLSNALKYRHPDRLPVVHVRARQEEPYVVLEVEDNGLGFDLAREEQLFAMFQRLHTHVEGTGIGLYMVKRMVENAGGKISVHSQVGVGTTFTIYFPR
ncbi:hypothetical protein BXP70_03770 [Hymenobacter crusticola]|uniref:histidine kinase n=2 Tax=Hymenobacter crusticola TaxID=1770526 RepID=A0A243WJA9_9BACT|nr:hypothetical protein BXP70_03770 [Hymenobacter crusticola]